MSRSAHPGIRMMQTGPSLIHNPLGTFFSALAVAALSFGPMFWMSQTSVDRYLILCASLPLSGVCFAWAWRERRRLMVRWAAITFASAFSLWLFFLFYYLFETHDEIRGLILLAANVLTNGILFTLLNHRAKKRDLADPMEEMAVI